MDEKWGEPIARTIEYYDPLKPAQAAMGMSGLDYLQAIERGEIPAPPITALFNMSVESVEKGVIVFGLVPDASMYNPIGAIHGGAICTVLDSVLGCAVHSTLDAGWGYTSVEIKVNYVRGTSRDSGTLTARGVVRKSPAIAIGAAAAVGFVVARLVQSSLDADKA